MRRATDSTLLVAGGPVLTMARPFRAEALAARDGHVVHVGSLAECRAALGSVDTEIDLAGRALVPGFVDAHCHPLMHGQTLAWVDCRPEQAANIDELVANLAATAWATAPEMAVRGFGYEHRRLAEQRHPTRRDLDRVTTDREVYVMNASGHGGVINSFALRRYGITADTPDPAGGRIGRDRTGEPDGQVWDAACDMLTGPGGVKIANHGPNFHLPDSPDVLADHLLRAQQTFLAAGVTTVGDMQVSRRELETYLHARDNGHLRLRVSAYLTSALLDAAGELGLVRSLGDALLRVQGIKFYADGTLGGWTAYFPEGYAADPCHHGQLYHAPDEYAELLTRAHQAGWQTATHAQSPHAIGLVLDTLEKAAAETTKTPRPDRRHRIEHCGLPTDKQIARMAELGVRAAVQPQHHLRTGDGTLAAVGDLGRRYNPCGLFAASGVDFALSSDAPVAPPAPLEAVTAAAERRTVAGTVLGGPELRLPVLQGLYANTLGAAAALHRDGEVGSLEPGKRADLAILDSDPTRTDTVDLTTLKVRQTWINGRLAWSGDA